MQKRIALSLLLALALGGCRSKDPAPPPAPAPEPVTEVDLSTVPCTCGDAMTAMTGCAHSLCAAGKHNPENPDCVCGPISLVEED